MLRIYYGVSNPFFSCSAKKYTSLILKVFLLRFTPLLIYQYISFTRTGNEASRLSMKLVKNEGGSELLDLMLYGYFVILNIDLVVNLVT